MNKFRMLVVGAFCLATISAFAVDLAPLKAVEAKLANCEQLINNPLTAQVSKAPPHVRQAIASQKGSEKLTPQEKALHDHVVLLAKTCIDATASHDAVVKAIPQDKPLTPAETKEILDAHNRTVALHNRLGALMPSDIHQVK